MLLQTSFQMSLESVNVHLLLSTFHHTTGDLSCCLPSIVYYLQSATSNVHRLPPVVCHPPSTVHHLPHCLPPAIHSLPSTVYLPPSTNHHLAATIYCLHPLLSKNLKANFSLTKSKVVRAFYTCWHFITSCIFILVFFSE